MAKSTDTRRSAIGILAFFCGYAICAAALFYPVVYVVHHSESLIVKSVVQMTGIMGAALFAHFIRLRTLTWRSNAQIPETDR